MHVLYQCYDVVVMMMMSLPREEDHTQDHMESTTVYCITLSLVLHTTVTMMVSCTGIHVQRIRGYY